VCEREFVCVRERERERDLRTTAVDPPLHSDNSAGMRSSVCVFSASRKAGNPVAVVLDPGLDYTTHVMAKIAERCVKKSPEQSTDKSLSGLN